MTWIQGEIPLSPAVAVAIISKKRSWRIRLVLFFNSIMESGTSAVDNSDPEKRQSSNRSIFDWRAALLSISETTDNSWQTHWVVLMNRVWQEAPSQWTSNRQHQPLDVPWYCSTRLEQRQRRTPNRHYFREGTGTSSWGVCPAVLSLEPSPFRLLKVSEIGFWKEFLQNWMLCGTLRHCWFIGFFLALQLRHHTTNWKVLHRPPCVPFWRTDVFFSPFSPFCRYRCVPPPCP